MDALGDLWPFLVPGLAIGSMYALIASGLVLTYQTSGIFNFAHGALAMVCAYCYYTLYSVVGLPTLLAFVLTVVVFAPLLGLALERLIFRHLTAASMPKRILTTVALFVALQGVVTLAFGTEGKRVEGLVPGHLRLAVGETLFIGVDQLLVVAVAIITSLVLFAFLRGTSLGTAIRAVVDRRDLAGPAGIDVSAISKLSWVIGTMLAGIAGVLLAPLVILDSVFFSLLIIQALAGAMFGLLSSIPLALLGGLVVGLSESLSTSVLPQTGDWSALRSSLPFLILFGVLLYYAATGRVRRYVVEAGKVVSERVSGARQLHRQSLPLQTGGKIAVAVFVLLLLVLPHWLSGAWTFTLIVALPVMIAFLSITVLTGYAGQISLCQASFMGIGAVFAARMMMETGLSFWPVLLLSGLVAVPFGLAIGLPALRLAGLFLALLTLGFGLLVDQLVLNNLTIMRGARGLPMDRPSLFGLDLGSDITFYYVVLAIVVVLALLVRNLRRSRTGRILEAIRESEVGVRTLGINPVAYKLTAFAVSAFLAGASGALVGAARQQVSAPDFSIFVSLLLMVVAVITGVGLVAGAIVAGFFHVAGPEIMRWFPEAVHNNAELVFGLAALIALRLHPQGLVVDITAGLNHVRAKRLQAKQARRARPPTAPPGPAPAGTAAVEPGAGNGAVSGAPAENGALSHSGAGAQQGGER